MQASALTQYVVMRHGGWLLTDIYLDVFSGIGTKSRTEFNRMIQDIKHGVIDYVITKSINRFGRNAEDILVNTKSIKDAGGVVYFQKQGFDSTSLENELYISIYAAVAESESEAISSNIRLGIKSGLRMAPLQYLTVLATDTD